MRQADNTISTYTGHIYRTHIHTSIKISKYQPLIHKHKHFENLKFYVMTQLVYFVTLYSIPGKYFVFSVSDSITRYVKSAVVISISNNIYIYCNIIWYRIASIKNVYALKRKSYIT